MSSNEKKIRNALITGAGRRIGRAIALDLASAGWQVAIHYFRSKCEAEVVVKEIEAAGGQASSFSADLGEPGSSAQLIANVRNLIQNQRNLIANARNLIEN